MANNSPRVSIITPTWNCASFLKETIKSVQSQTYTNWEMLIQDDCSNDDTALCVKEFADADPRIKYARNSVNSGAARTRNNALSRATGQFVAFLDSDDLWMPTKLEKQLRFMEGNDYAFSYTNYYEIDEYGNFLGNVVTGPQIITRNKMLAYCWPGCLTVMYDASKIGLVQIGDIKNNNDYAMWLKISTKSKCYLLDEPLAKYRRGRKGSVSTQRLGTLIKWHYKLFHESEGKPWLSSIIHTCVNLLCGLYKKLVFVKRVPGSGVSS